MYQCYSFRAFNFLIYQGSAWIDPGSTCINRSFTWALPGWSGGHPGWLVGNTIVLPGLV
jgi:hypothetical protein